MSKETISDEVESFIHAHINSVEQLEALKLLYQASSQTWTVASIAARLYTQPESAATRLDDLAAKGLCFKFGEISHVYQYRTSNAETHRLVSLLMDMYRIRRDTVITIIFSKPAPQRDGQHNRPFGGCGSK